MSAGFLYNNKDYKFPKGHLCEEMEEMEAKLASGEWLEGPGKPPGKPKEPKRKPGRPAKD